MSKKSPYYFIDTNIFLRVLIRDNEKKFSDVTTFLEGIRNNLYPAYTSSFVLAELVWTLSSYYKLNKADVVKSAESILNLNGLSFVENHDSSEALSLYKKYNVKFVDCLIYSNIKKSKGMWKIVSYDTDFDKLGTSRVEPNSINRLQTLND